ncbi:glycosyltransferase [Aspergillus mulundensis]|uniref:Glycosyltransferase family 28 N-terminal domain-containing protein n=1 Tax=Aspergillus mulundensis TaxID=1810919 RepID=A0A3D8SDE7_9EURO|nr:hypothetical protein DSM5745_04450 [Aspergillus mulundensis]RDW84124.1 hypothetical protein DSM5745_04450 [Aspergillus mulundensis]
MAGKENLMLHDIRQDEDDPPPAYSPVRSSVNSSEVSLWTAIEPDSPPEFYNDFRGVEDYHVPEEDGKLVIDRSIASRTSAFVEAFMRPRAAPRLINVDYGNAVEGKGGSKNAEGSAERFKPPPLDILVMIVDEDVEPFIYIAKRLLQDSHRVRIAADTACEPLVRSHSLDFFTIGTEPNHANNGGEISTSVRNRNHNRHHKASLFETYSHCWRACIAPYTNDPRPFLADVIIATPTASAHIHCAERLSIPLHIMSATPQTPTKAFPHPRARFNSSEGIDTTTANILSYALVQERTWYTSIEPINRFRQRILGLMPISSSTAATLVRDHSIPHTYFCSKLLVPKPVDWPENQDISGYIFREQEALYRPPPDLESFLLAGRATIYFMMHESTSQDPRLLASIIQKTVLGRGFRALFSRKWQHIAASLDSPDVFVVDSTSNEWVLPKVSLVVHNGDAQSVKLALQHGKPSITLAKTEDQHNLGVALAKLAAGASPLSLQTLTPDTLAQGIEYCLRPDIQQAARTIQSQLIDEGGAQSAVQSFYRWLPPAQKRVCTITQRELAVFRVWNKPSLVICAEAAAVLLSKKRIGLSDLVLTDRCIYRTQPEDIASTGSTTKEYWTGLNTAVKDIVRASDLVGKLSGSHGRKRLDENGAYSDRDKSNPARDVGVGTAKFFGHVALLPFTSTALVVNSAIYAVKSVQAHIGASHDDKKEEFATEASYDFRKNGGVCPKHEPSISSHGQSIRGSVIVDSNTSAEQSLHRTLNITNAPSGQRAPGNRPGESTSTAIDQIQMRNDEHVLAIFRRYLDRGIRSERVHDEKFRQEVLDVFEVS